MKITRQSPLTGEINSMEINISAEQISKYRNGALIQDAFPHLSPDEREFIKTGYTKEDWETMFGPEE